MSTDVVANREYGLCFETCEGSWSLRFGSVSLTLVFVLATALGACRKEEQTAHGRRVLFAMHPESVTDLSLRGKGGSLALAKRKAHWYVGADQGFPADRQVVRELIDRWARLESRKVLLSPSLKVRRKLGLDHPCLIARFGQGPRESIEVRVGCSSGKDLAMMVTGDADVHLVRKPLDSLGERSSSVYMNRAVSVLPSNEVVRFVVKSDGSSAPVDVRRAASGEWQLVTATHGALAADRGKVWSFLHALDAASWSEVPKVGPSSAPGTATIELWNLKKGPAAERIAVGGTCSAGVRVARTGLFPASGCLARTAVARLTVRGMDLLDRRLLPLDPADVRRVEWPGTFQLLRTASRWVGKVGGQSFSCDAEQVVGFVKTLASTRGQRVVAVSNRDRNLRCIKVESERHQTMAICLRRGVDGLRIRRGDEPIELVVSESVSDLFAPAPLKFRSRVLAMLPLSQIDVVTVRRGRIVERVHRSSGGSFVMASPVVGRPDPEILNQLGQVLSHFSVTSFLDKAPSWFHPDMTLSIGLPDLTQPLSEVETFQGLLTLLIQSLWPAVLDFHLSVERHHGLCVGRLWNLTFRLDARTCRILYQPLAPRRLFPSVLVDSVRGLTLCRKGVCQRLRRDHGQWRKTSGGQDGQPNSVNQAAVSDRVTTVVFLRANRVLDYSKPPKTAQMRICLDRSIPIQIRGIAGAQRLARLCILFDSADSQHGGRSVWVQGRSVQYVLTSSQVHRLLAPIS